MKKTEKEELELLNAIYAKQRKEISYWVGAFLGDFACENISIHSVGKSDDHREVTIIYDVDAGEGVLIRTTTDASTVEASHEYMWLTEKLIAKIASLHNDRK